MKYIKINTPLQVVGGFSTARAIVNFTNRVINDERFEVSFEVYKSFDDFDTLSAPIELVNPLPPFSYQTNIDRRFDKGDEFGESIRNLYLTILKDYEYDVELIEVDDVNLLACLPIFDFPDDMQTTIDNEESEKEHPKIDFKKLNSLLKKINEELDEH